MEHTADALATLLDAFGLVDTAYRLRRRRDAATARAGAQLLRFSPSRMIRGERPLTSGELASMLDRWADTRGE